MRKTVDLGDRTVTLVGTAHVSQESKEEVHSSIEELEPDFVGVELDESRYDSLRNGSGWKDLNIVEAIREGKGFLLFMNLILSIYQRRIGLQEDVKPGEELLEAVKTAEENDIEYGLIDRDINETFRIAMEKLSVWEKLKLVSSMFIADEEMEVEDLKEDNMLNTVIKALEEEFPTLKETFLDERNRFMAKKILDRDFENGVVVVGAAHVEGLAEELQKKSEDIQVRKEDTGFSLPWLKILKYGIPALIISMLAYSFYKIGFCTGLNLTGAWILMNGIGAFIGAVLARAHPATWIVSFVSAPLTSLSPAIGAGMVAAYFEGKFFPPTVEELESVAEITGYRDLWSNQASKILLVFILVSIGSAIATFAGAGYIASSLGTATACTSLPIF
ncbi:TraB/GumN family protein [Candidatus Nanosalina sp. VS9-1]|uniref:TraB/GumN family protein n=1 Tax=Candidatus Nanosalina sp. VS9-1 TaxID=3388566 RepID=UPI0039E1745E